MARPRFHFVRDYRRLVRDLLAKYPLQQAMSLAVGGNYDAIGEVEKQILLGLGLQPGHTLIDVGCGSGRLAKALVPHLGPGRYFGTDILQELLDYARVGCPESWQFACVEDIRIPFPDDCADFASFFSVFTHLLHEESYCYLLEARRVVKAGGTIVFSFLEYEDNWPVFENAYTALLNGEMTVHLNMFIHRDVIAAWAQRLGMSVVDMRGANEPFVELTRPVVYDDGHCAEGVAPLGQSVCVLRNDKPAPDGRSTFRSYETSYRVV
ncbi:MAG: class I SAM-dependent methyltransferase [Betaproteobacteria bacterium]|nr:MAG: class I SAM-dependent methyltransferase [Betaproteobacteria bacterium]